MKTEQDCPFCRIVRGEDPEARVVHRDRDSVVFFPLNPATRGHTLIVPTRHVPDISHLETADARNLADRTTQVARAVQAAVQPEGINVIQSNGKAATQTVEHLHVHVVPRWTTDDMQLDWPEHAAEDDTQQDTTLTAVRREFDRQANASRHPLAEDRRQHLALIQAVIGRMAQASASSKTWLLPIVTATFGYAITQQSGAVALLGVVAVAVFGLLDANYLKQERAFRQFYDDVASGKDIPSFSMVPSSPGTSGDAVDYWPGRRELTSWAVLPIYGPLVVVGLLIFVWQLVS